MSLNTKALVAEISTLMGQNHNFFLRCNRLTESLEEKKLALQIIRQKKLADFLESKIEAIVAEIDAQEKVERSMIQSMRDDVNALEKKSTILMTYIEHIQGDDFEINKTKKFVDEHCLKIHSELALIVQKKVQLVAKWEEIQNYAKESSALKKETELAMDSLKSINTGEYIN